METRRFHSHDESQARKPILDVSERVSGQDNNWNFSSMMNNHGDCQSDESSNEDPEERRPTKKKKKNLSVVDSDKEHSQIESDNEIDKSVDSKEEKSRENKKKRPVIVNEKNFLETLYSPEIFSLLVVYFLSYFVTTNGEV